jgi:hypothetical protein
MTKVEKIERGVKIPITKIHPNPWNPNVTSERQQKAIAESLQEYSQVLEVVVRPHPEIEGEYQIIDGEHRFQESDDYIYANVLHGIADADAKKLTIVLNETRGEADKIKLSGLLEEIKLDLGDDLIIALPYEQGELDELLQLADIDWDNYNDDPPPGNEEKEDDEWVSISCRLPKDAYDVLLQAKDLISEESALHKDKAIAWGQVLERLSADYLAR